MRPLYCLMLLTAGLLSAADQAMTPRDVARLRIVVEAEISPDGARVAYVLSVPRDLESEPDGPAWRRLHVVDRQGLMKPYVGGRSSVRDIAWTDDGRALTYLDERVGDETRSVYQIALSGGEARRLYAHAEDIESYSLNADDRLAFVAAAPRPLYQVGLRKKGFTQKIFEEDRLSQQVWIVDPASQKAAAPLDLRGSASDLLWNPAGDRLAVTVAPSPRVDDRLMNRSIVIVDPGNGERHGGYRPPGKFGDFRWSPDGKRLAVIASQDRSDPGPGRLIVFDASSGEAVDVLPDLLGHVRQAVWVGEESLLYSAARGTHDVLGRVRADGQEHSSAIPTGAGLVFGGISQSQDGTAPGSLAVILESAEHPPEVGLLEPGRPKARRLTDSNPWLSERRLAKQEVLSFRARDGLRLEGVLIRPLGERSRQRYPLILYVHGGPESHESDGWLTSYSRPGQVAAARGFAVFHLNFRGSTGRGVEFSKLDHGDFAGKEFDDLVDAADHLASLGLIDRERVGVTGGSYGGYATAWAATALSEHFAAGVMFVGISDQVSKSLTTDIPTEIFETHQRRRLQNDWQFFLERSPIFHAHASHTPLLILHGEKDTRVPTHQSLELYRLLKQQGQAPVRLVLYPAEGHGNRRAAARYDYNLRMLRWMEHYLQGPGGDAPAYELDYLLPTEEPADP